MVRFITRRNRGASTSTTSPAPGAVSSFPHHTPLDTQQLGAGQWVHSGLEHRANRGVDEARLLVVHVPKTGGTSLRRMFSHHVDSAHTFLSSGKFQWMSHSTDDLRQYQMFVGHNFLEPLYMFPEDPWVTVLPVREPLQWWQSMYKFRQRGLAEQGKTPNSHDSSFDAWIEHQDDAGLSNPQTSWLLARTRVMFDSVFAGDSPATTAKALELPGNELAALADRLVDRMSVIGVTDDLYGIYQRTCEAMGWEPKLTTARRDNTSEIEEDRLVLSEAQSERLERLNLLDGRMYERARQNNQVDARDEPSAI